MSCARFRNALGLTLIFTLCASPLFGQTRKREIHGTVVAAHGHEPLKGAIVQLKNEQTLSVITFHTDRRGAYVFHHLDDGEYILSASYRGRTSSVERIGSFDRDEDRTIDFTINLR